MIELIHSETVTRGGDWYKMELTHSDSVCQSVATGGNWYMEGNRKA